VWRGLGDRAHDTHTSHCHGRGARDDEEGDGGGGDRIATHIIVVSCSYGRYHRSPAEFWNASGTLTPNHDAYDGYMPSAEERPM
jgi:hypothetical protein